VASGAGNAGVASGRVGMVLADGGWVKRLNQANSCRWIARAVVSSMALLEACLQYCSIAVLQYCRGGKRCALVDYTLLVGSAPNCVGCSISQVRRDSAQHGQCNGVGCNLRRAFEPSCL